MPLRDHFHSPLIDRRSWDGLFGAWPAVIVMDLNKRLPPRFVAQPRIHLGTAFEIDVATSAIWVAPQPTLAIETEFPDQDEYEVHVYEPKRDE